MPSIVKIRIVEARHLPVMDRATGSTDAFVVVRFAGREEETNVVKKTLTPRWDEDFRFDIQGDAVLQNEPLILRVMDSDTFGGSNPVGLVHVSLTPLLTKDVMKSEELGQRTFTAGLKGWFPIFDTLEGIRGEIFIVVKVQNIADENPYSESSSVVEIFSSSWLDPETVAVERVLGFVEELVVDEDPEYSWSNNFYSARLTNEARLNLMYKLSMAVRRLVGKKALELGANAVIGFQQHFDIEGNSGMVCRGYGTACVISKNKNRRLRRLHSTGDSSKASSFITVVGSRTWPVFSDGTATSALHRADETVYGVVPHAFLLDPPKGSSQSQYLSTSLSSPNATILTMQSFPVNVRLQLGGIVAARSVKFLGKLNAMKADRETRDQWWAELRAEVKSHAEALMCTYVVGYSETCVIFDDVCILSATGTAAVLKESKPVWKIEREDDETEEPVPSASTEQEKDVSTTSVQSGQSPRRVGREEHPETESGASAVNDTISTSPSMIASKEVPDLQAQQQSSQEAGNSNENVEETPEGGPSRAKDKSPRLSVVLLDEEDATALASRTWSRKKRRREIQRQKRRVLRATLPCASMHVPYKNNAAPFANMRLVPCGLCKNKWVPEMLLSTTEPPPMLPITGGGTLVEARVCKSRPKADTRENDAGSLGEHLVFLEIELHRQLMLKLKVMGMNAAFSLRTQINLGAELLVGVVSATAVHTPVLPPPAMLRIKRNIAVVDTEDMMFMNLQQRLEKMAEGNRDRLMKIAVAEAESVRQALERARAKKSREIEDDAQSLKWRKLGENVARDAAIVAKERLTEVAQNATLMPRTSTPSSLHEGDLSGRTPISGQDHGQVSSANERAGMVKGSATGWFARRRRNQENAELLRAEGHKSEPSKAETPKELAQLLKAKADTLQKPDPLKTKPELSQKPEQQKPKPEMSQKPELQKAKLETSQKAEPQKAKPEGQRSDPQKVKLDAQKPEQVKPKVDVPQKQEQPKAEASGGVDQVRWPQGKRFRANLGLGTVRNPLGQTLSAGSKSPLLSKDQQMASPLSTHQQLEPDVLASTSPGIPPSSGGESVSSPVSSFFANNKNEIIGNATTGRPSSFSSSSSSSSSSSTSESSSSESESDSSSEEELDEEEAEGLLQELRGDKNCFVVEIDDETDEDIMAVLFDRQTPPDIVLCTSNTLPQFLRRYRVADSGSFFSAVRTCTLDRGRSTRLNLQLAQLFHQTHALLALKLSKQRPCVVAGIRVQVSVPADNTLALTMTASVSRLQARTALEGPVIEMEGEFKDIIGLPPLLSSVFNPPLDNSPGLLPMSDPNPALGLPARSPTVGRPLVAFRKHFWSISNNIIHKSLGLLRNVSRSTTGESTNSHRELNSGAVSSRVGSDFALGLNTDRGSEEENDTTGPATIAGLLGIKPPEVAEDVPGSIAERTDADPAVETPAIMPQLLTSSAADDEPPSLRELISLRSPIAGDRGLIQPLAVFRPRVVLTALEYIPGARITQYLGRISIHLIKESPVVREGAGLSTFYYPFMLQAHAIARAHVEALGGNALLSFRLIRRDSEGQKNQTYNLISLSGDVVLAQFSSSRQGAVNQPLPIENPSTMSGSA